MRFLFLRRITPLFALLLLDACADTTGVNIAGGKLLAIGVTDGKIVEVGDTVRLTATGGVDGLVGIFGYDILPDAIWAVSDPTTAQLESLPPPAADDPYPSARTLVRGRRPGSVRVTATARGVTGAGTVRVIPVVGLISVTATRVTLGVGEATTVTAAAFDASGVPIEGLPLTFEVRGGAQLSGHTDTTASIVAIAAGPVTVTVRLGRATGTAVFTVIPPAP